MRILTFYHAVIIFIKLLPMCFKHNNYNQNVMYIHLHLILVVLLKFSNNVILIYYNTDKSLIICTALCTIRAEHFLILLNNILFEVRNIFHFFRIFFSIFNLLKC